MKNRLLNVTTYIFLLTLCFSCRKEKGVITKEYYSNGNLKYIEYFEGQDTFPMIAKSYYSDGSLHTSCYVDRNGTCNGMYVTYYQDGRLQDSCEFYNGVCIRQLCNEFPNKSNCFIMIQGNNDNERIFSGNIKFIPRSSQIHFSTFLDGLPYYSCYMYYKYKKDKQYKPVVFDENNANYPFSFFTSEQSDTLGLYFMFPNDSNQIIIGKTPQIKFDFVVE